MSEVINPIHTPCKHCVFAIYNGQTQTDCHLDYISKYKDKRVEILEAYDNDKEFYVINNKKCIGYRENSWFEKRNLAHLTIEEKIQRFKEFNFLHYLLVINLKTFHDEKICYDLLENIKNLDIKPRKIIVIRYQNDNKQYPYEKIQSAIDNDIKWRIQTILVDREYENILHEIINLNKKYRFVLSIKEPTSFDDVNNIINKANHIVYEDMDRFIAITNKDKSSILFSAPNYRHSLLIEKQDILTDSTHHIII